jgi:creatinine amidohydrolase
VVTAAARVRVVDAFTVDVRDLLAGQDEPMHADEVDTSLLLHLAPELVHPAGALDYMVERPTLRRFRLGQTGGARLAATAVLGRPSLASAEKGRAIYERIVTRIAARVLDVPAERLATL